MAFDCRKMTRSRARGCVGCRRRVTCFPAIMGQCRLKRGLDAEKEGENGSGWWSGNMEGEDVDFGCGIDRILDRGRVTMLMQSARGSRCSLQSGGGF